MQVNRNYTLESRPSGELKDSDLKVHEDPIRAPSDGEIQVRTTLVSIDPANRIWMSAVPSYMPPMKIGEVVRAAAIGVVEQSGSPDFEVGDKVAGLIGWATHPTISTKMVQKLPPLPIPDEKVMSLIGVSTGMTAYFGLLDVAQPKEGETMGVDAAAGAVGSLAGQIGKIKGLRVVGIAGGPDKCKYVVDELGFDACIDYKNQDVGAELDRHCPDGIDVCFENVGGPIFDSILMRMNVFGRVALCGMIAGYNAIETKQPGPYAFGMTLMRRLKIQGFIVTDYVPRMPAAQMEVLQWGMQGKLKTREDIRKGFENLPESLRQLLKGQKHGKMLVAL